MSELLAAIGAAGFLESIGGAFLGFATGLAAGAAHALLGPDHLAAVVPLSVRRGASAAWIGLRWGVGHALGALLLGGAAVAARDALSWPGLSAWAERGVGAVLVCLGLWSLWHAGRGVLHVHDHEHGGERHRHAHLHGRQAAHAPGASPGAHRHPHAALGIGFLHGLAGFGHLWAALPALALPRLAAAGYLLGYGAGTTLAMAAFAGLVGAFAARAGRAGTHAVRALAGAAGALAIGVGLWWLASGGV